MKTTLILLRHGTSEPFHIDGDFTRRLTPKGEKEALAAGARLAADGLVPDGIVYSPATRTEMTLSALLEGLSNPAVTPVSDESIYEADTDKLWHSLQKHCQQGSVFVMIGHNPGLSMLTDQLAHDDLIDKDLFVSLSPGSMAILDCGEDWQGLAPNAASLIALVHS